MLIKFEPSGDEIKSKLDSLFPAKNYVVTRPGNKVFTQDLQVVAEHIRKFHVKPDDTWVVSYPRTGSTWAQEMIWLLQNNLDYESAKKIQIQRSPLLEACTIFKDTTLSCLDNSIDFLNNHAEPRSVKTHLPWELLPDELNVVKPKVQIKF